MNKNDPLRTVIDIDENINTALASQIEFEAEASENGYDGTEKTVLDMSDDDDYASYNGGTGFSFEAEGIDEARSELPLSNHLQAGMTLKADRYRINKVVGAGGFGVVYNAYDSKLNVDVAIKELYPSSLVNRVPGEKKVIIYGKDNARQYAYLLDRFLLEAKNMAKFHSVRNIVNIYDCFQENNTAYIVMEYIKGRTLEQYIRDSGGRLSVDKATEFMNMILDGLSAIHSKGIIHRDIKPKNIFITPDNGLKIIDFGAARFSSTEEQIVTRYSKVLTPGFAPPEQYRRDSKQGPYTDIYAASAVYYYMVTGTIPEISVDRVVNDDIKPLRELVPDAPEYVERAVGRALELNSDLRLQTAAEFKSGLNGKRLIRYVAEEKKMRFKRRVIIIAATAAALCLAALGVVSYKLNSAEVLSIDKLVSENTEITLNVPLSDNSTVSALQEDAWNSVETEFEEYIAENSEIEIDLSIIRNSSAMYTTMLRKNNPDIYLSYASSEPTAAMEHINQLINEETTLLYNDYVSKALPSTSYIIAFDPTVMYINEKLLRTIAPDAEDTLFESISDIESVRVDDSLTLLTVNSTDAEYYSAFTDIDDDSEMTALERFCAGEAVFYIGHVSDDITVSSALTGLYSVIAAPNIDGVRAVGYELSISNSCTENETNAAQLLLSFITGEDMQDILFVQSGSMIPVNPSAYNKFFEFNPQFSFINDRIDGLYFCE